MFVILAYDVGVKRNSKVKKTVKKYLRAIQKSVFDGNISERNLNQLKFEVSKIIDFEKDSVVIYRYCWGGRIEKDFLGIRQDSEIEII